MVMLIIKSAPTVPQPKSLCPCGAVAQVGPQNPTEVREALGLQI